MENKKQNKNPLIKVWLESIDKIDEGITSINDVHGSAAGLMVYTFDRKEFGDKTEEEIAKEIEERFWKESQIVFNSSKVVVKEDYVFIVGFASKVEYVSREEATKEMTRR